MMRSWASEVGSMGPPISGTHSSTPKWTKTGNVSENWGAVEGALWFADHDCFETTVRVCDGGKQLAGLRTPLPWDGAALSDIEVLGDDLAAAGIDESVGPVELPLPAGVGVLLVFG
jgi:hypothetical protein